ncbi:MAG TPA: hypothetical protein DCR65_00460 [Gammaproteobacteria bacterium]|nr:hypothetical protein [Gammaproteobacteria bacterium]
MADLETLAELARAAVADVSGCSPAELHGAVCGLAVFNPSPFPFDGLADLLDARIDPADPSLWSFVEATCGALEADDFGFALLLPELDDASTAERLAELARWCARFLDAFARGLADFPAPEDGDLDAAGPFLPPEVQEIIDDLAAIADADAASAEDLSDEVESDLVELEEFVKVGVLLMRSVLSHDDSDNPA